MHYPTDASFTLHHRRQFSIGSLILLMLALFVPAQSAFATFSITSATGGTQQVALVWTGGNGGLYHVKRSTTSGSGWAVVGTPSIQSYTDTGLADNKTYYYVITNYTPPSTETGLTAEASATTRVAVPTGLAGTGYSTSVGLSWNSVSGATSYNVKRATAVNGTYNTVSSPSSSPYTDTGLTPSTTYYYKVSAANSNGEGANSGSITKATLIAAPTSLLATASPSSISLTWTAASGQTAYNVYRSTVSGSGFASVSIVSGSTSYNDTGLASRTTYYYQVKSYVTGPPPNAESDPTNEASGLTTLGIPANLAHGSTHYDHIDLTWDAVTGATSYTVYRATASGGTYSSIANPGANAYTDSSSLTPLTTYYYKVAAVDSIGTGSPCAYLQAGTGVPPPSSVYVDPCTTQIHWTPTMSTPWVTVGIYRSAVSGGPYTWLIYPTPCSSWIDNTGGMASATTYYYVVTSYNPSGIDESDYSFEASVNTAPLAPTSLSATAGSLQVGLTWTASPRATTYNIYRGTSTGGETLVAPGVTSASYTDTGLSSGTTYYYQVRAMFGGCESYDSNESSASPTP
jgi:fibronectin type 3 domain-containing protein